MKSLFFLISLAFFGGCTNRSQINEQADQVESISPDHTDVDTQLNLSDGSADTSKTINENVAERGNLKTLTSAIETAELTATLSGSEPLTMFAPSDSAFKVSSVKVKDLQKSGPDQRLQKTLTYHLVAGAYRIADMKDGMELTTVQGKKLRIRVKDGKYTVNGAEIIIKNIVSKNGVIHVIDKVLIP